MADQREPGALIVDLVEDSLADRDERQASLLADAIFLGKLVDALFARERRRIDLPRLVLWA